MDDDRFHPEMTTVQESWHKVVIGSYKKSQYLARTGRPDSTWDGPHAGTIGNRVEQSLWQKTGILDRLHQSNKTLPTTLFCWRQHSGFQTWKFAGRFFHQRLVNSKSITVCAFGSQTCVPISWIWKKQTAVSHSSAESETIFVDAGLRLEGIHSQPFNGCV